MMSSLISLDQDLDSLVKRTKEVTNWHNLGVHLKIPHEDLEDIAYKFSQEGITRCKTALFVAWTKKFPDASWAELVRVLEECNENATANQIRQWLSNLHAPVNVLPPSIPLVLLPEDEVTEFRKIEILYAELKFNLINTLEEKQVLPLLGRYLSGLLELNGKDLIQASSIDNLFELISPYYCFLNTAILGNIIDKFLGEPLKNDLEAYRRQLEDFKKTITLSLLEKISPNCSLSTEAPRVTIKLAKCWQSVTIARFQRLVEQIFKESCTALANIKVETGCICITWFTRISATQYLITQSKKKTKFMRLVGVLRMSVADVEILEQEEEEKIFCLSTALVSAVRAKCVDAVEILLEILEADPNSSESGGGHTPLMIACSHGSIEIARLLLQFHANVNQQLTNGCTALMSACALKKPHNDLVKLLVQSGADINLISKQQRTALMYAAERGHTNIVQYLEDNGAPVNTQDVNGSTSLMRASEQDHYETVRALTIEYVERTIGQLLVQTFDKDEETTQNLAAAEEQMRGFSFDKFRETMFCKIIVDIKQSDFASVVERIASRVKLVDSIVSDIILDGGKAKDYTRRFQNFVDKEGIYTFVAGCFRMTKRDGDLIDIAFSVCRLSFKLSPKVIEVENKNVLGIIIKKKIAQRRILSKKEEHHMQVYCWNKVVTGFRKVYSCFIAD